MPRLKLCVCVFTVALLSAPFICSRAMGNANSDFLQGIKSTNFKERLSARDGVVQSRAQLIRFLLQLVVQKDEYELFDSTGLAIELLGKLRAKESVGILAEYITLKFPLPTFEIRRKEEYYLAAVALTEIGLPAIPLMIKNISESADPDKRNLSKWVIQEVLGHDLARSVMTDALEDAKSHEAANRLEEAIKNL